jgi:hypothetical protein
VWGRTIVGRIQSSEWRRDGRLAALSRANRTKLFCASMAASRGLAFGPARVVTPAPDAETCPGPDSRKPAEANWSEEGFNAHLHGPEEMTQARGNSGTGRPAITER